MSKAPVVISIQFPQLLSWLALIHSILRRKFVNDSRKKTEKLTPNILQPCPDIPQRPPTGQGSLVCVAILFSFLAEFPPSI